MLKQFFIVASIASLPVVNEITKTYVTKTKSFKKIITEINKELNEINISIEAKAQITPSGQENTIQQTQAQQRLFEVIVTPSIQAMLSRKSKNKIQLIKKLKSQQKSIIQTNALILLLHSLGSFASPLFFYRSAIFYCSLSQLSLLNDMITMRTGKQIVDFNFKSIGEIYLKISSVMLVVCAARTGFRMLRDSVQSKQLVRRDP